MNLPKNFGYKLDEIIPDITLQEESNDHIVIASQLFTALNTEITRHYSNIVQIGAAHPQYFGNITALLQDSLEKGLCEPFYYPPSKIEISPEIDQQLYETIHYFTQLALYMSAFTIIASNQPIFLISQQQFISLNNNINQMLTTLNICMENISINSWNNPELQLTAADLDAIFELNLHQDSTEKERIYTIIESFFQNSKFIHHIRNTIESGNQFGLNLTIINDQISQLLDPSHNLDDETKAQYFDNLHASLHIAAYTMQAIVDDEHNISTEDWTYNFNEYYQRNILLSQIFTLANNQPYSNLETAQTHYDQLFNQHFEDNNYIIDNHIKMLITSRPMLDKLYQFCSKYRFNLFSLTFDPKFNQLFNHDNSLDELDYILKIDNFSQDLPKFVSSYFTEGTWQNQLYQELKSHATENTWSQFHKIELKLQEKPIMVCAEAESISTPTVPTKSGQKRKLSHSL